MSSRLTATAALAERIMFDPCAVRALNSAMTGPKASLRIGRPLHCALGDRACVADEDEDEPELVAVPARGAFGDRQGHLAHRFQARGVEIAAVNDLPLLLAARTERAGRADPREAGPVADRRGDGDLAAG